MKKILLVVIYLLIGVLFAQENKFVKTAETKNAVIIQKGESKTWCSVCGMNLKMFYKSNHALELDNGLIYQYCSIRCLASDIHNYQGHIKKVLAVDVETERFIDAEKAFYVIGSDVPGTMTKISKIAFAEKKDAIKFSKKHHGKKILTFDVTLKLAKEQMDADNAMLMKKKQMKVYPKGKKLYEKMCSKDITFPKVSSISELKAHLKSDNNCKEFTEKQLQMVALYLWEVKLKGKSDNIIKESLSVPKDAKCPVCGMFVYKYMHWAAVLEISHKNKEHKLYFDGVKDLMKFYLAPEKWGDYKDVKILNVDVTDYYKQTVIDGKKTYYVIGSDVLGPMGNELIPFEKEKDAIIFSRDHFGKKIVSFNEITENLVNSLNE